MKGWEFIRELFDVLTLAAFLALCLFIYAI